MHFNKVKDDIQWDEIQIKFLSKHTYFTETSKKLRNDLKEDNLLVVKMRLETNKKQQ